VPSYPSLTPQLIGQTEKTLNAVLDRLLAGTGLTEPQWVTLTLTAASHGSLDRDQLTARVAGATKFGEAEARARIDELAAAQLVQTTGDRSPVRLTGSGEQLHTRVRREVGEITERLWGDTPAGDLATAARVLTEITSRANAELAALR
jgi:hypothetical protein